MKIHFVRHGETNYNVKQLFNDKAEVDVYLTRMGKKQAREIRALLADKKIQRVYISEFPRTRETGEIVMQGRFAPFDVDPRINDRCSGFDSQPLVVFFDALDKSEDRLSAKYGMEKSRISPASRFRKPLAQTALSDEYGFKNKRDPERNQTRSGAVADRSYRRRNP